MKPGFAKAMPGQARHLTKDVAHPATAPKALVALGEESPDTNRQDALRNQGTPAQYGGRTESATENRPPGRISIFDFRISSLPE